ncbi:hypothetical protein J5Y09_09800 [Roseomonas sp. PWR1]|uniref:Uncharacterized protein n=1 Tax=Roseomonas nitratireducens TaxID=2820810 RepID=A0ABS4AS75_9PROT|nr:hypothetical protein [Neoroseomonas nitratireducens]MBP0464205.1 hypothetical protein [Neoroseomonas nitratireducens]
MISSREAYSLPPAPSVWAGRFTCPEDMAEAQRDANLESIPIARDDSYRSRLAFVDLGRFRVHDATDDAHIARGAMLPRACGILFPWGSLTSGLRVNGLAFSEGQGVFVKPGAEMHVTMDGPQRWSGIIMDDDAFAAFGGEAWLRAEAGFFALPDLLRRAPARCRMR